MSNKIDKLLDIQGGPGKYVLFVYFLIFLNYFPMVFNTLGIVFYQTKYPFKCNSTENSSAFNHSLEFEWNKCSSNVNSENKTFRCDGGWMYNMTVGQTSVISDWDLVCSKSYLVSLLTTIYFSGVMAGGFFSGYFSDHYGRKPVMLTFLLLSAAFGAVCSFMYTYSGFAVLRFLQGVCTQVIQTTSYSLLLELSITRQRVLLVAIFNLFWDIASVVLAGVAYFVREWRYLQLIVCLPSLLTISYIWLLPESPRFLLQKNKKVKVEEMFIRISKLNKRPFDRNILQELFTEFDNRSTESKSHYTILHLLQTRKIRTWSLLLFYKWMVISIVYYGVLLSITDIAEFKYVNFIISAVMDVPGYFIASFLLKRFGRRHPLMGFYVVSGLSCVVAGLLSREDSASFRHLATALAILGKVAINSAFCATVIYTNEIFPTVLRSTGHGTCAVFMRIGGMLAPQIVQLGEYFESWIPTVIMGSLTLICVTNVFFLPETANTTLPDTLQQAQMAKENLKLQTENEKYHFAQAYALKNRLVNQD